MLYREPAATDQTTAQQGLKSFNLVSIAPGSRTVNRFPFYFQSGLVYTGLLPGRDRDLSMISIAYGSYQRGAFDGVSRSYTAVIEGGYRFQLNGWAFLQPFAQYFIRPAGSTAVSNATILGFSAGLVF